MSDDFNGDTVRHQCIRAMRSMADKTVVDRKPKGRSVLTFSWCEGGGWLGEKSFRYDQIDEFSVMQLKQAVGISVTAERQALRTLYGITEPATTN